MGLFEKKNKAGIMDVIRCDEPTYLILEWHPTGAEEVTKKENSIR